MAYPDVGQIITIPDNYVWDTAQAEQRLQELIERSKRNTSLKPYIPGAASITDTLRSPGQTAQLYPMNAINEALAKQEAFGVPAGGAKGRTLADLLNVGEQMARSKITDKNITGSVVNALGFDTEQDKTIRAAQTKATASQGESIDADLLQAVGTPEFDVKMAEQTMANKLRPNQQLALERLHQSKLKSTMLSDKDRQGLTNVKGTTQLLTSIEDAFKETPAFKTGKVGATLKTALALTQKGASAIELAGVMERLTPEERRFISLFKSSRLSLRRVSEDSRFSNFDAEQVIDALGNPLVGPDLYLDQLNAAKEELTRRHDNALADMKTQGRRVEGFSPVGRKSNIPQGAKVTGRTHQGKPVYRLPTGELWVE